MLILDFLVHKLKGKKDSSNVHMFGRDVDFIATKYENTDVVRYLV